MAMDKPAPQDQKTVSKDTIVVKMVVVIMSQKTRPVKTDCVIEMIFEIKFIDINVECFG